MVGSGGLAAMGVWCLLFGGEGERARASGWPFRNEEAKRVKVEGKRLKEEERVGRRRVEMEMEMQGMRGTRLM